MITDVNKRTFLSISAERKINDLFVIAAGGTGAKVVEALTHLCAAGLAPGKVRVLLVDGDVSNGNRLRTLRTWESYKRVQSWPWCVRPNTGETEEISVFSTDLEIYSLAEPFSSAEWGSLRALVSDDPELRDSLSVVFDDEELDMDMRAGLAGRSNLGCLIMSRYLHHHLREHDRAKAFIQALRDSVHQPDGSNPRIAVVGSVFGGTGASLFSIAKQCVRVVFKERDPSGQLRTSLWERMHWGKVMLLPYFQLQEGVNLEITNSSLHVVDTSRALWYYGLGQSDLGPVYVIGSDTPHTRRIVAASSGAGQNNPPFYHELLAALALLDFHAAPQVEGNHPIRHFSGFAHTAANQEFCALTSLPAPTGLSQELVRSRLALLFHLASFSVDWRESPACPEFFKGLFQYAKESKLTGWDKSVHEPLMIDRHSLVMENFCEQAIEYFARVLLWGQSVLASETFKSSGLDYDPEAGRYASLHNTLCLVRTDELEVPTSGRFAADRDNLAAKICRLALAGLAREDATRGDRDNRGHRLIVERNRLLTDANTVRLGNVPHSLAKALLRHGFATAQIKSWFAEFQLPTPER